MYDEEGGGGREKMLLSMWPLSGCVLSVTHLKFGLRDNLFRGV